MSRFQSRSGPASGVCAVNREDFQKSFFDVPKIVISSIGDVKTKFDAIIPILSKSSEDWNKRLTQIKMIRSIIIHSENIVDRSQLLSNLIRLTDCLELSVKDLRSQILREAAITCSFIAEKFGNDARQIGEQILAAAFSQVAVSTKVMATSGATLVSFIVQHTQTKQIFTTLASYSTSKDKNQRRQLATLLETVIIHWNEKIKTGLVRQISELIKSAICDADPDVRIAGRKAFGKFEELHADQAEQLFQSMDSSKQKMLRKGDASSSNASVNSERGSVPIRSKLSAGSRLPPNISAKFLAQRSASAIDTKQITRPISSVGGTPSGKYTRPIVAARTLSKVDTSPGGSKFARPSAIGMGPRTLSNVRAKTPLVVSQPGSRNGSPTRRSSASNAIPQGVQRVKSNLGGSSFMASLSKEEARKLQESMSAATEQLRQPSRNADDEFLLPKRVMNKTPQKSALDVSRVEAVLRACASSSANDKREGIKRLGAIVTDPTLSDSEVKEIGTTLTRLLSDATNTVVLESVSAFVQTHHNRLGDWLQLGLHRMFNKKGAEMVPNMRKQIGVTFEAILCSFDPMLQLKSTCELMCNPIHLLNPKSRVALLEYLHELIAKHMERGSAFNGKQMQQTMMKMFSWMSDQRNGQSITPYAEKVICALFALNAADFSALFNDFNSDYRDLAYRILQSYGHQQHDNGKKKEEEEEAKCIRQNICNTAAQIEDFVANRRAGLSVGESPKGPSNGLKNVSLGPLKPLNSSVNEENNLNESFDRLKLNSTAHLADDANEQNRFVNERLAEISSGASEADRNQALMSIGTMLSEGSFTLWEQNFAKLLLAVFGVLEKCESDMNKKLALRVLSKICIVQAARLFDSTEMAICKVIDAVINSKDGTIIVSADDCLKTLATHLPLAKVVNIAKLILDQNPVEEGRASLVLKMLTNMFDGLDADELTPVVDDVGKCAIKAYESPASSVRKAAVYCLVSMVNKLGSNTMEPYLTNLTRSQRNLIHVYIQRTMSSSHHSHV